MVNGEFLWQWKYALQNFRGSFIEQNATKTAEKKERKNETGHVPLLDSNLWGRPILSDRWVSLSLPGYVYLYLQSVVSSLDIW